MRHDEEAIVRKQAFERFTQNPNKGQVARALSEAGYRTRTGLKICDVTVGRWLRCPSAIGKYAVNKIRKGVELPPEEWTFIECEPIIERELWEAVQAILNDGGGSSATPKKRVFRPAGNPLTPLVSCKCGKAMVLESSGNKFVCRKCRRSIPKEDLEDILLKDVRDYLSNRRETLEREIATPEPVRDAQAALRRHQDRLFKLEAKMNKIHELFMSGSIDSERFGKLDRPLTEEREALRTEARALERALARAERDNPPVKSPPLDVEGLIHGWSELPFETRQVILTELFEGVVVGDGALTIRGRLPTTPLRTPTIQQPGSPTTE